jgi:hypothetical protein
MLFPPYQSGPSWERVTEMVYEAMGEAESNEFMGALVEWIGERDAAIRADERARQPQECARCQAVPCCCPEGPISWRDHALNLEASQPEDSPTEQEARGQVVAIVMDAVDDVEMNKRLNRYRDAVRGEAARERNEALREAAIDYFAALDTFCETDSIAAGLWHHDADAKVRALLAAPDAGETRKEE